VPIPDVEVVRGSATDRRDASALAVVVRPGQAGMRASAAVATAARELGVDLEAELTRAEATGEAGALTTIPLHGHAARTLHAVGVGDGAPLDLRRAGAALARAACGEEHLAVASDAGADGLAHADAGLRAFAEGLLLAAYAFSRKSVEPEPRKRPVARISLAVEGAERLESARAVLARATATATAVHLARDLANTPSNEKDPAWLAAQAERVAAEAGLGVQVWDERALAAQGFGGILAVGQGSARPPRLIQLSYQPTSANADTPHVVLIGKGITFDTGGLSLKPREAMIPMKTDMAAGGAVIAVLATLAALGVTARVTGLVAAAENMPGGSAVRPGDVIRHYGGTTVEVMNTDAEGRLVLADALAYADAHLDPDVLIDMATLTGAASQGLGRRHGALYSADDGLVDALVAAGEASGDRVWRMPLVEDYRPSLDSAIADLCHISRDPKIQGGSITAALFLREFVGARRWAHLDIAGPARSDGDEHEVTKGGTGFGTRLLLRWLEDPTGLPR
jgi:leucyl aminopeptidase